MYWVILLGVVWLVLTTDWTVRIVKFLQDAANAAHLTRILRGLAVVGVLGLGVSFYRWVSGTTCQSIFNSICDFMIRHETFFIEHGGIVILVLLIGSGVVCSRIGWGNGWVVGMFILASSVVSLSLYWGEITSKVVWGIDILIFLAVGAFLWSQLPRRATCPATKAGVALQCSDQDWTPRAKHSR